ncbi:MAG TPA: hypothetical protein PK467_20195, partial [Candidatus Wallbacteria bacterium]|nr:hypothetical protein [Candidatus Wallbacteria bacterium]
MKLDLNLNYIDKFTGTSGLSALRGVTAYDQYCFVVEQGKHRLVKTGISKFAGEVSVEDSADDAATGNSNHSLVLLTNSDYITYPLVVYEKNVSGTQKIYFKMAKDEDATEYDVENVISEGTQFAVTSAKSKRAYMAFIKSGKVMFSMNDGCDEPVGANVSFSTPVIVSGAQTDCANPSITVDKDNHVYVAWESGGKIHYNLSTAAITQKINAMTGFSDTNISTALCSYDGDLSNISISADRVGNKVYASCVLTKDGNSNVMFGKGSSEKGSITSIISLDKVPINGAEGEKISGAQVLAGLNDKIVYLTWSGSDDVFYAKSKDYGSTFDDTNVTLSSDIDKNPSITVGLNEEAQEVIMLAWDSKATVDGNEDIYFSKYADETFEVKTRVNNL